MKTPEPLFVQCDVDETSVLVKVPESSVELRFPNGMHFRVLRDSLNAIYYAIDKMMEEQAKTPEQLN